MHNILMMYDESSAHVSCGTTLLNVTVPPMLIRDSEEVIMSTKPKVLLEVTV
jgi:hypothetical protein